MKLFPLVTAFLLLLTLGCSQREASAEKSSTDEVQSLQETIAQLRKELANSSHVPTSSTTAQSLDGYQSSLSSLYGGGSSDQVQTSAQLLMRMQADLRSQAAQYQQVPRVAQGLTYLSAIRLLFQFVDDRIGARAYAAVENYAELVKSAQIMSGNGFRLEGLTGFLPKTATANCSKKVYQYVYSDPAVGYLFAYLTLDPNGERPAQEPMSYRVNWSPNGFGILCNGPGKGLAPLHRFWVRNGQIPGQPYIGVVTAKESARANLQAQGWNYAGVLGYIIPAM